jgi:hypothetical protein
MSLLLRSNRMKQYYFFTFVLFVVLIPTVAYSQEEDNGEVKIYSDARLAVLLRKNHSYVRLSHPDPVAKIAEPPPKPTINNNSIGASGLVHRDLKMIYTGPGFRVQIYNGSSRDKAVQVKAEFMRRFPGVHTYLTYISPNFRVKIGDYRSRTDAEGMLREANSMYSPSMIVPDVVTISTY